MKNTFTFWHDLADGREVLVTYSMTPPVAATRWQPAEGCEVEVLWVEHDCNRLDHLPNDEDAIFEAACDRAMQDWTERNDEEADYRYEQYRERMLERRMEGEL